MCLKLFMKSDHQHIVLCSRCELPDGQPVLCWGEVGEPASLKECDLDHSPSPWLAPNLATSCHLQDVNKPERERDSFSLILPHLPPRDVMRINEITDEVPPRKQAT